MAYDRFCFVYCMYLSKESNTQYGGLDTATHPVSKGVNPSPKPMLVQVGSQKLQFHPGRRPRKATC